MVSGGITMRFPISLHRPFLRITNTRKPLKPACTIPYDNGVLTSFLAFIERLFRLIGFCSAFSTLSIIGMIVALVCLWIPFLLEFKQTDDPAEIYRYRSIAFHWADFVKCCQ